VDVWTGGWTFETHFIRSTRRSRPNNNNNNNNKQSLQCFYTVHCALGRALTGKNHQLSKRFTFKTNCTDSSFASCRHLANTTKQRCPTPDWQNQRSIRITFDSGPYSLLSLLCEHMTLSTKPEVHNALLYRHSRIEPRP